MSDLIRRMDAVQACQVGPSDEWSRDTKSGYSQAATDCAFNILRVPAVQPVDHAYKPSMDPNDQGECVICGGGPHTAVQPVTAQAQIDAAVAAERKRNAGKVARLEATIRYYERRESWRARETN